jgi:hypothetical protein
MRKTVCIRREICTRCRIDAWRRHVLKRLVILMIVLWRLGLVVVIIGSEGCYLLRGGEVTKCGWRLGGCTERGESSRRD